MCGMCEMNQDVTKTSYWKNPSMYTCHECSKQNEFDTLIVKGAQILGFVIVISIVYRLFVRSINDSNVQVIASIRIFSMVVHFSFLISKMQAYEALNGVSNNLQSFADHVITYASLGEWLLDF